MKEETMVFILDKLYSLLEQCKEQISYVKSNEDTVLFEKYLLDELYDEREQLTMTIKEIEDEYCL